MDTHANESNSIGPDKELTPNNNRQNKDQNSRLQRIYWITLILSAIAELAINLYHIFRK
jgi:hypothetical protein